MIGKVCTDDPCSFWGLLYSGLVNRIGVRIKHDKFGFGTYYYELICFDEYIVDLGVLYVSVFKYPNSDVAKENATKVCNRLYRMSLKELWDLNEVSLGVIERECA